MLPPPTLSPLGSGLARHQPTCRSVRSTAVREVRNFQKWAKERTDLWNLTHYPVLVFAVAFTLLSLANGGFLVAQALSSVSTAE